jgi:uncharacterized protein
MDNLKRLINYAEPRVAAATILVIGALLVSGILAKEAYYLKTAGDRVSTTGSAKTTVAADQARATWRLETKTGVYDQEAGYQRLARAAEVIDTHLANRGFENREMGSIESYPEYRYESGRDPEQTGYTVSRMITVRSNDLDAIATLSEEAPTLSKAGYSVSSGMIEYTVSTLPELRVSLLSEAIRDARERAEAIAKDSGRSISSLRSASSGVVQVLPQGGVEISDYGSYDTQSRTKDVMVTVRAEFSLR